jgi:hypothetical protein
MSVGAVIVMEGARSHTSFDDVEIAPNLLDNETGVSAIVSRVHEATPVSRMRAAKPEAARTPE